MLFMVQHVPIRSQSHDVNAFFSFPRSRRGNEKVEFLLTNGQTMHTANTQLQPQPPAFDIPAARANLRRRFQERRRNLDLLTEQARKDAQCIADMLIWMGDR